jgi:uncharacterized protein YfaS (alpha-2-macroglobulin family)
MLVVTDLGLIAKRSVDGTQDVFVQSIATGEPVAGATVQVIARNGQAVLGAATDGDGHAHLGSLRDFKEEREPVLYLARRDSDSSFLPLRGQIDEQDLSRFDVGGVSNSAARAAITAYLFSDRGIYRPGDEIRAAAIIKPQDWRPLPDGLPLRLTVTDPRGQMLKRELLRMGSAGFEELRYQSREAGAVGTYTFSLYLISNNQREDMIGTLDVKVQEFLPDRLRMTTRFTKEQAAGWVTPEDLQARVTLENLFGTPASARRVRATMRLSPAAVAFAQYRDYQFHDPQAAKEGFTENLEDATTSESGEAALDLNLGRFARATYRVTLNVEGYEADGGRGVSGETSQLVSNLPFLVGWKADGRVDFIPRASQRAIELIAVDPQLARTAAPGLRLRRIERRFVSVLLRQDSGLYKYESRVKEVPLDERELALPGGQARIAIDTATPGNFSYVIDDAAGQVYARIDYTIAGQANLARSMEKNAELQIALDKQDYAPGETLRMQIQAPHRHRPDHHRARPRLRLALVPHHDQQLHAGNPGAGRPGGQRLRERKFRARSGLRGNLHGAAVLRRQAVLDRAGRAAQPGDRARPGGGETRHGPGQASCRWRAMPRPTRWRTSSASARWMSPRCRSWTSSCRGSASPCCRLRAATRKRCWPRTSIRSSARPMRRWPGGPASSRRVLTSAR